jgi:tetratricopeptide (TPR) repeat protein
MRFFHSYRRLLPLVAAVIFLAPIHVLAQGGLSLFGDVKINGADAPTNIVVILYKDVGGEIGRQGVANRSRYRFNNLAKGDYELVIESNNEVIGRMRVVIGGLSNSPYGFQQDLDFNWKAKQTTVGVVAANENYSRTSANAGLFAKAQSAAEKKNLDNAISLLTQVVENDKQDFQAWTLLGTLYSAQSKAKEAESSYRSALDARPTYTRALIDLGRLLSASKRHEEAIEPLTRAVETEPSSGEANLLLGECYLQVKKGSKAIPHLEAAARLGHPEAHLRLGWLYNAAGAKDRAAIEYEEFLKKKPDYPDRAKLKEYIQANKKSD